MMKRLRPDTQSFPSADDFIFRSMVMPSDFYAPTQLLLGENIEGYSTLANNVIKATWSFDFFEDIWNEELIDLIWHMFRLRWLQMQLLNLAIAKAHRSAMPVIDNEIKTFEAERAAKKASKEGCEVDHTDADLEQFLDKVTSTRDARLLTAQVLEGTLDLIERIDNMIAVCQLRRNTILREITHHRMNFLPLVRQLKEAQIAEVQGARSGPSHEKDKREKNKSKSRKCATKHGTEDNSR